MKIIFFRIRILTMSKRQELKVFDYALLYFIETDEIGIIKRSQVLEGYQNNIKKDAL